MHSIFRWWARFPRWSWPYISTVMSVGIPQLGTIISFTVSKRVSSRCPRFAVETDLFLFLLIYKCRIINTLEGWRVALLFLYLWEQHGAWPQLCSSGPLKISLWFLPESWVQIKDQATGWNHDPTARGKDSVSSSSVGSMKSSLFIVAIK